MLVKWDISNFKSVKQAQLELGMLTFVAGANNVGKSSLIQSILLVAQTLSSKSHSKCLELNGHLFRFGFYEDIKPSLFESDSMSLGFTICPLVSGELKQEFVFGPRSKIKSVSAKIIVTDGKRKSEVASSNTPPTLLNSTVISFVDKGGKSEEAAISVNFEPSKQKKELKGTGIDYDDYDFLYHAEMDDRSKFAALENYPDSVIVGSELEAFLPSAIRIQYDHLKFLAHFWTRQLCRISDGLPRVARDEIRLPSRLVSFLEQLLSEEFSGVTSILAKSKDTATFADWYAATEKLTSPKKLKLKKLLRQQEEEIESFFIDEYAWSNAREIVNVSLPDALSEGISFIRKFFTSSVKYLGPLRDEPKAIYPLPLHNSFDDIGLRGEFTASVLHHCKESIVDFISPNCFMKDEISAKRERTFLLDAVENWLKYLQMGDSVETKDEGKLGHTLKMIPLGGSKSLDLTHFGAGVGQILPVLVFGLLGKQDDILIIEQPELHLHPLAQARLADFLLSLSMLGKQCLIETHSEHLIKRIRYRIASNDAKTIESLVRIYFANGPDGGTNFTPVEINEFGAIVNWPEGFFDQSEKESQALLQASVSKRLRIKKQ